MNIRNHVRKLLLDSLKQCRLKLSSQALLQLSLGAPKFVFCSNIQHQIVEKIHLYKLSNLYFKDFWKKLLKLMVMHPKICILKCINKNFFLLSFFSSSSSLNAKDYYTVLGKIMYSFIDCHTVVSYPSYFIGFPKSIIYTSYQPGFASICNCEFFMKSKVW